VSGGCNVVLTNTGELWDLRGHLAAGGGGGREGKREGSKGTESMEEPPSPP